RELQLEEILVPDLAAALPGHRDEGLGAIQPDCQMSKLSEGTQVASGTAAAIENTKRSRPFDVPQQRVNILRNVVIARAFADRFGPLGVVMAPAVADRLSVF